MNETGENMRVNSDKKDDTNKKDVSRKLDRFMNDKIRTIHILNTENIHMNEKKPKQIGGDTTANDNKPNGGYPKIYIRKYRVDVISEKEPVKRNFTGTDVGAITIKDILKEKETKKLFDFV